MYLYVTTGMNQEAAIFRYWPFKLSEVHNNDFDLRFQWQCIYMFSQSCCRYDQCRSPSPSRTWLQNAMSPELSQASVRYHAGVLEEGGDGETHF